MHDHGGVFHCLGGISCIGTLHYCHWCRAVFNQQHNYVFIGNIVNQESKLLTAHVA